ncbi:MAG: SPOR domain-containing protein, partial [Candidatus Krumholzibacteria bacterium]|nr:SPOR domain-containing protein [Candidatus Krumholzibacteria bacterium]
MTLAELDMQDGKINEAIDRYETIAGEYSNPIAGFKLGECYEILGERAKALKVYRTLMRKFPISLEAPKAREKVQMMKYSRHSRRGKPQRKGGDEGEYTGGEKEVLESTSPGYTIQVGAFSERENAIRLAKELEMLASDVRIERIESNGRIWHRVRVGRYSSRKKAQQFAKLLQEKTGRSSKILPLD